MTDPATDPAPDPMTDPAPAGDDLEAAEAAAEDGPDVDLNVNDGDPLPPDDVDDGQDD